MKFVLFFKIIIMFSILHLEDSQYYSMKITSYESNILLLVYSTRDKIYGKKKEKKDITYNTF